MIQVYFKAKSNSHLKNIITKFNKRSSKRLKKYKNPLLMTLKNLLQVSKKYKRILLFKNHQQIIKRVVQDNILTVIFQFHVLNNRELISHNHQMIKTVMMRTVKYQQTSKRKNLNSNFPPFLKTKWTNMENHQEETTPNHKCHPLWDMRNKVICRNKEKLWLKKAHFYLLKWRYPRVPLMIMKAR